MRYERPSRLTIWCAGSNMAFGWAYFWGQDVFPVWWAIVSLALGAATTLGLLVRWAAERREP